MNEVNTNPNDDGERLITQQEARLVFRLTPMMLQHIKPLGYYLRVGSGQKVYLYRFADIQAFLDSEVGKQMMKDAEMRRQRFYNGVDKRVEQYREWLRQAKEQNESDKE